MKTLKILMGLTEIGAHEHESSVIEKSESSEILAEDKKYEHSTPENHKMDCDRKVTEIIQQKEVTTAQNIGNILVSTTETSVNTTEMEPNQGEIFSNAGAEKTEPLLESTKMLPVVENMEVASQNGLSNLENMGTPLGMASDDPGNGEIDPMQIDATNDSGHLGSEDRAASGQSRKRKSKVKGPVTSSWSLRSKSQDKPKAPEPTETVEAGSANGEKKRRGRKKKQMKNNIVNEFSRVRTHLRYLFHRIKYEQSLIDAYSAEGWKGQRSVSFCDGFISSAC